VTDRIGRSIVQFRDKSDQRAHYSTGNMFVVNMEECLGVVIRTGGVCVYTWS
jgi:hypothetical protein